MNDDLQTITGRVAAIEKGDKSTSLKVETTEGRTRFLRIGMGDNISVPPLGDSFDFKVKASSYTARDGSQKTSYWIKNYKRIPSTSQAGAPAQNGRAPFGCLEPQALGMPSRTMPLLAEQAVMKWVGDYIQAGKWDGSLQMLIAVIQVCRTAWIDEMTETGRKAALEDGYRSQRESGAEPDEPPVEAYEDDRGAPF